MDSSEQSKASPDKDRPSTEVLITRGTPVGDGQTQVGANIRVLLGFMGGTLVFISALLTQGFISDQGLNGFLADQASTMAIVGAVGLVCCWLCWRTGRPVSNALANTLWIVAAIVLIFGFLAKITKFWLW